MGDDKSGGGEEGAHLFQHGGPSGSAEHVSRLDAMHVDGFRLEVGLRVDEEVLRVDNLVIFHLHYP